MLITVRALKRVKNASDIPTFESKEYFQLQIKERVTLLTAARSVNMQHNLPCQGIKSSWRCFKYLSVVLSAIGLSAHTILYMVEDSPKLRANVDSICYGNVSP